MTHPIIALQGSLVAALAADAQLVALAGEGGVFDAPPKGRAGAHVTIARHDLLARDAAGAPGNEHRLLLHAWAEGPSRRAAVTIVERVVAVALGAPLDGGGLLVTHRVHERTDTEVDGRSGRARAAVALRMFTEPG